MTRKEISQVDFMLDSFEGLEDLLASMKDLLHLLDDPTTDAYEAMAQASKLEDVAAIVKTKTTNLHTFAGSLATNLRKKAREQTSYPKPQ